MPTLGHLDREHAAVYFQIIWDMLRAPMRRALEALVMDRQTEGKATFPPFAQQLIERGFREGELKGLREGELKGLREGELKGLREALLRFIARAGIALTEDDHTRINECNDVATLDRWIDNVFGAKTAADILS
ncbi:MAG: hypothetical protein HUU21_09165 [Polyangiaceae bacterium]|nr:hypothetical protein [Polyangiaceae bacterium]